MHLYADDSTLCTCRAGWSRINVQVLLWICTLKVTYTLLEKTNPKQHLSQGMSQTGSFKKSGYTAKSQSKSTVHSFMDYDSLRLLLFQYSLLQDLHSSLPHGPPSYVTLYAPAWPQTHSTHFLSLYLWLCHKCIRIKRRGPFYWLHTRWASDDKQTALPGQWACLINYMHVSQAQNETRHQSLSKSGSVCLFIIPQSVQNADLPF